MKLETEQFSLQTFKNQLNGYQTLTSFLATNYLNSTFKLSRGRLDRQTSSEKLERRPKGARQNSIYFYIKIVMGSDGRNISFNKKPIKNRRCRPRKCKNRAQISNSLGVGQKLSFSQNLVPLRRLTEVFSGNFILSSHL